MKKMMITLAFGLLPITGFAKDATYRFPAQAGAAPKLVYTASCEILKANLKTSPKWVNTAQKELVIKPSSGKNDADIVINADDIQVEYTALVNEMPLGGKELYVTGAGFLKIKNLKTSDVMQSSSNEQMQFDSNRETDLTSTSLTYTAGYIDPRAPNSYMISCKIAVK